MSRTATPNRTPAPALPGGGQAVAAIITADPIEAAKSWRRLITGIDPTARPGAWQLQGPWLRPGVAYDLPAGALVVACDQHPDRWHVTVSRAAPGGLDTLKEWMLKAPMGKRVTDWIARRLPADAASHVYQLLDELPNLYEGRCHDCRRPVPAGTGRVVSVDARDRTAHLPGACPPPPPPPQVIAPNRRGEECLLCGGWVAAGDGVALRLAVQDPVTGSWYRAAHPAGGSGCPLETVPGPPNRTSAWCHDCGELVPPGAGYWLRGEMTLHHRRPCPPPTVAGPTWIVRPARGEKPWKPGEARRVRIDLRGGLATVQPPGTFFPAVFRRPDQPDVDPGLPGYRRIGPTYVELVGVVVETVSRNGGRQRARVRPASWSEAAELLGEDAAAALAARPDAGGYPARWAAEKIGRAAPWAAEITGRCPGYGYRREFLPPDRDYRRANSRGTRGVWFSFTLLPNRVYETCEPLSHRTEARRFVRATAAGHVVGISREEVEAWLNHAPTWHAH